MKQIVLDTDKDSYKDLSEFSYESETYEDLRQTNRMIKDEKNNRKIITIFILYYITVYVQH